MIRLPALLLAGAAFIMASPTVPAQTESTTAPAIQPRLTRVTLFTSGVAEFVHETRFSGAGVVRLTVPESEMSDVLRSLTVLDSDGGTVYQIDYAGGESLAARLDRFRIDIGSLSSLSDLAAATRGRVVVIATTGGREERGRIAMVSSDAVTVLRSDGTLRSLPVESIEELRFVDEAIAREVDRALDVVADAASGEALRTVSVHLRGTGDRRIALRYLREMPVWKTSYRAVLQDGRVTLQGWAHIDNTSTLDWNETTVRLVSAAPDTYFFDLYPPEYVHRRRVSATEAAALGLAEAPAARSRAMVSELDAFADSGLPGGATSPSRVTGEARETGIAFTVTDPVSLPRGASAMVPLVNAQFSAETVRSFDPRRDREHPRIAVAFTNESESQLPGGPLTIFDGDRYVGDAVLPTTPAGAERVVPYARDQQITVSRDTGAGTEELRTVRIVDGTLVAERRGRRETVYRVAVDGGRVSVPPVRVSHPRAQGWEVVSPQPRELDPSIARIETSGRTTTVVEERLFEQRYALTEADRETLLVFSANRLLEPRVRRTIRNVVELRDQLSAARERRAALESERRSVFQDQERIRGNMATLDRDSSLYRRYVSELSRQEDRLDLLDEDLRAARDEVASAEEALSAYLATLE